MEPWWVSLITGLSLTYHLPNRDNLENVSHGLTRTFPSYHSPGRESRLYGQALSRFDFLKMHIFISCLLHTRQYLYLPVLPLFLLCWPFAPFPLPPTSFPLQILILVIIRGGSSKECLIQWPDESQGYKCTFLLFDCYSIILTIKVLSHGCDSSQTSRDGMQIN